MRKTLLLASILIIFLAAPTFAVRGVQRGRTANNSGIGLNAAKELAHNGAKEIAQSIEVSAKFIGGGIALAGLFLGIGIAINSKRSER